MAISLIKHNLRVKLEHIYLFVCLGIVSFGVILFGYWENFPTNSNIIKINDQNNIQVDKKIYHWGDTIKYTISYCKKSEISSTLFRSLVNGTTVNFTPIFTNPALGCHSATRSDLVVPSYVLPGMYHIEATAEYKLNPIRNFYTHWKSVEFEIRR